MRQALARIAYSALIQHKYVAIEDYQQFLAGHKALARHFSGEMKHEVQRLLLKGNYPVYYEVSFDIEQVAQDKLFLGRPEWAAAFGEAFKDGVIRCIFKGSKEAVRRIRFVGEIMDDQKAYGARIS